MGVRPAARSARIDALRGLAVFGILLINVWGFVYGYTPLRYGVMPETAGAFDRLAVFFAAAFAEQKFYPIFAFLFGAGFALQMRSLRRMHALDDAKRIYRRRLAWLLVIGILHGTLLWFGDILTSYALTGFWLLRCAGMRLAGVLATLKTVAVINVHLLLLIAILGAMVANSADVLADTAAEAIGANAVYTLGDWQAVTRARLDDFGDNMGSSWLFMPRLALLFLLGVVAVRLGWLTHPERHRLLWRRVLACGLVGALPLNLWWGYCAVSQALAPVAISPGVRVASFLLEVSGPALGAAYVAAFMLARDRAIDVGAKWLEPVGRMALTNYLMQSLACGLLLHGYGLGLGAMLPRAQLIMICLPLMLAQIVLSRWWLSRFTQGPLEALWRRYTYRPMR